MYLKLSYLLSELVTLMSVLPRDVACGLHDPDGKCGQQDSFDVEARHEDLDPAVHHSQHV